MIFNCGEEFNKLLAWHTLIGDRCVEIVRTTLESGTPKG